MDFTMKEFLSFDDVLILPKFSEIRSRKEVDISTRLAGMKLQVPVISSNMDTITEARMATEVALQGGVGALHRFMSIEENIEQFLKTEEDVENGSNYDFSQVKKPIVSFGVGEDEILRAKVLFDTGAKVFLLDVAHGASIHVVEQYEKLREYVGGNASIIVGNFATARDIESFVYRLKTKMKPDAYKIGIGGGSMCTTRVVTGCGLPTLGSIIDCATLGVPLIADGGMRTSGDIAKALAAGATAVMLGSMLSGTEETPGEIIAFETKNYNGSSYLNYYSKHEEAPQALWHKKYRGSASLDSYKVQNKIANHRAPEGEATLVKYKGSVKNVMQTISGGLRSAFSYVGSKDYSEFKENATLVRVTTNGAAESKAHGKEL
jgi:IMP dehydrogenase